MHTGPDGKCRWMSLNISFGSRFQALMTLLRCVLVSEQIYLDHCLEFGCTGRVIFFSTLVLGSGNVQLSHLAGLGYGLGLRFWVVFTIIVSLTLTLTSFTNLAEILP